MYKAAITMIPHTRAGLRALDILKAYGGGLRNKRHGRGARGSNGRWAQDLPFERSTHFTLYTWNPITPWNERGAYQRAEYVGTEPNGKIRLRVRA
jgi:hypothetical protein